jgi:hypothetical protein
VVLTAKHMQGPSHVNLCSLFYMPKIKETRAQRSTQMEYTCLSRRCVMKMEAARNSCHNTTRCHNTEDRDLNLHRREKNETAHRGPRVFRMNSLAVLNSSLILMSPSYRENFIFHAQIFKHLPLKMKSHIYSDSINK